MKQTNKIAGNFVLLSLNDTNIIVPQSEVEQAQYLPTHTKLYKHDDYQGVFLSDSVSDAFFISLSENLLPLEEAVKDRLIVLAFKSDSSKMKRKLLWTWTDAQVLLDKKYALNSLPDFICKKNSPIKDYIIYKNEIAYYCDTEKLISYALSEINL